MIRIEKAPPFATVQDLGWRTGRAFGLPRGGAMDPTLLTMANTLVGNPPGAAGIEWALGSGTVSVDRDCLIAVLGAEELQLGGQSAPGDHPVVHARRGGSLTIVPGMHHRFIYIAVRGGIDVPPLMGSRSTYIPGGFGGYEGRRLTAGDLLPVGPAPDVELGSTVHPRFPVTPRPAGEAGDLTLMVTPGPQWDRFGADARDTFFKSRYLVSSSSDRMGYRLDGPPVVPSERATLPSEAACPGAVQIPDGGQPIVLMPDGPTVGGYAKIAVLRPEDLRRLAQAVPGRPVRFTAAS
jgi:antagonist of KipI